jgi:S1-C subfamily serine protease
MNPGSRLELNVLRQEKPLSIALTTRELGDLQGEDFECKSWGFTVRGITAQMKVQYQLPDTLGIFVTGVKRSSSADEGGLRPEDVITKVDNHQVSALQSFIEQCNTGTGADKTLLTVRRNGATRFIIVKHETKE